MVDINKLEGEPEETPRQRVTINTNPRAFARVEGSSKSSPGSAGMDLRDYFAATALNGLLTSQRKFGEALETPDDTGLTVAEYAVLAYDLATAMLRERLARIIEDHKVDGE